MSDLTQLTISQARGKLHGKEITATEITEAYLSAIDRANPALNAYVAVTGDKARDMAKASDARLVKGEGGALEGIPLGIKDLFGTEGVHTQACSHVLDGFKPRYESTVTSNLWADGAIMLGKLNMDEFAMGSSNETSYYGPVINPWRRSRLDTVVMPTMHQGDGGFVSAGGTRTARSLDNAQLVPGGSSGGSATAVSAFLCAGATATDTGGSIRQPAAFTGTVGIKPTYGRCSRWGIVAFASSLDQAGPIARDVRDAAILLKSMASVDPKDTTSVDMPVPDYEAAIGKPIKGMKVGIPREYRVEGMPEEIEALWQKGIAWLKDAGAEIVDISLPHTKYALPAYYIVAPAEASSNLARYDGVRYGLRVPGKDIVDMYEKTRAAGFGREVKRRIMIGTYVLSAGYYDAYYLQAQKVRNLIKRDFETVFAAGVDVILTPATPSAAFGIADEDMAADPVKMYLNDIFTVTVNMAGLPGIAVPAGLDAKGLPLGLQLIGRPFDEETLFQTAAVIEQAAGTFQPEKWW
ncbi:Asp-tRNA(Asn)/Glu-tRNA(Gln) amidotransferase subunit GatA [Mesorhizobium sp. M7A.F.Ca.US.006.04.2.1]|uniref:amidase n=1 Tax=unclassified Mesorhizobium TaxID=325217 RepID=UPI000FCADF5C|nr:MULTISPECIES: amidase family protein [unclassified Mesorhizobium]RUY23436.1 Asp-tRNA(Asn)/Glu-tRNA(Gln) amidotransferase subunit GatA [Mesorhizobium sp. M7A.F.Ca.US.001.04.2.1]RUY39864.1 Asp-tRNA(Asn)/Glu-tRNA(Gln) amidotransferase subunit GatA [Mesorhizobium sp. M7A.F.Ca.US.001.04.1.1]RUZ99335.1 Asp-tRNA(Asn)/Glu-tRNA(Gln) amidotransferase subunit GatA [Mesorhizobium sp. M7A.F.Ca.US.001.02.1.1]RVA11881.1 Asp-tRNA(Asn)/Glu-tRNA(Gln) amidotransferase subunit GatA [Mesorhizobium sp. M7A.F.Ca.U